MIDKIGPYRVYERLGVGGMGEVYKAYDDRLDRWVAIKRIRPDREDAEDNRERFKREARATARLNHPSIVHLYGIFQEGDSDCIVMEYVDGKTLDQLLAEGPLDPLRVANLGHEIAAGLAEAHANGILHRDLKAENIMISPRGRAKILDFGLAKPILRSELDPVLTGKGQLVGTSRAMSPEYVSGEEVDHRSDLFSLGVLLYECLTGHSPFKAHNTLATLKQVMMHKQTSIKVLNPRIPTELSDLIDQLLEKDPGNRPQSAHEIALAFGRLTGQVSSGIVDIPGGLPPGNMTGNSSTLTSFSASDTVLDLRPRHRWMTLLAVIIVLVASAFFLGKFFSQEEIEPLADGEVIWVVLGDFANDVEDERIGESLLEPLRLSLGQSKFIQVLSPSQIKRTLKRMQRPETTVVDREVGLEVANRESAHRLVLANISQFGNKYALSIEVVDPVSEETMFTDKSTADGVEGILNSIEDLAKATRRHLGESADQIQSSNVPLERVTTPNLDALKAYSLGTSRLASERLEEAVTFFQNAIELDPSFAMAHAKLVVVYANLFDKEKALEHADIAFANSGRLTETERLYLNGWVARWRGSFEDVIGAWSLMSEMHPEVFEAHFNLGLSQWYYLNNFVEAKVAFEKAGKVGRQSNIPAVSFCLGYAALAENEFSEAKGFFDDVSGADYLRGMLDLAIASEDENLFEQSKLASEQAGDFDINLWRLKKSLFLLDQGLYLEAKTLLNEILVVSDAGQPGPYDALFHLRVLTELAVILEELGELDELESLLKQSLEIAVSLRFPEHRRPGFSSVPAIGLLGRIAARNGFREFERQASDLLVELPEYSFPIWEVSRQLLASEILRARGELDKALELLGRPGVSPLSMEESELAFRLANDLGDSSLARERASWISEHRGLALAQCAESCFGQGRAANIAQANEQDGMLCHA